MSVSVGGGPSQSNGNLDSNAEINLAPIIDFLIVLITYLLAAASFITLGGLGAGVADIARPTSDESTLGAGSGVESVRVTLELGDNNQLRVVVKGSETLEQVFPGIPEGRDFMGALSVIKALKEKHPNLDALTIQAEDSVRYQDIIKTVSYAKKQLPIFFIRAESL